MCIAWPSLSFLPPCIRGACTQSPAHLLHSIMNKNMPCYYCKPLARVAVSVMTYSCAVPSMACTDQLNHTHHCYAFAIHEQGLSVTLNESAHRYSVHNYKYIVMGVHPIYIFKNCCSWHYCVAFLPIHTYIVGYVQV